MRPSGSGSSVGIQIHRRLVLLDENAHDSTATQVPLGSRRLRMTGRPKHSPEAAKYKFLLAGYSLSGVPGNPWQVLMDEVFPKWYAIQHPNDDPRGIRRISYVTADVRARRAREAREVLVEWANKYRLIGSTGPLPWIIHDAEERCRERERTVASPWSGSTRGGWGTNPIRDFSAEEPINPPALDPPSRPLHPLSPAPWLILQVPPWERDNEPLTAYKQRARKALTKHFEVLKRPRKTKKEQHQASSSTGGIDLRDYEWLILRRCCGWMLKEIRERDRDLSRHPNPESAHSLISLAVCRKERLLGLLPLSDLR
jgi:hypothetical protein